MGKKVMYFAVCEAARVYEEDGFDAMIAEIEDYNGSVERIEFDSEQERKAFCRGLEFAAGYGSEFFALYDEDIEAHKDILDRFA